ncbi:MAG: hypothetical protein D6677_09175 [Calditrichaeota bacterium]|nr:MAG: hypothetical protein D6677_09175 [Calditrichota bacterium]
MSLINKTRKNLLSGLRKTSAAASEYARIGRLKIDLLAVKKELEEKLLELGGRVYQLALKEPDGDIRQNPRIEHIITEIKKLDDELRIIETELKKNSTMRS